MAGGDAVDPELLRQALDIVGGSAGIAEPALAATFDFNRAAQLMQDGRTAEAIPILRGLAAPPAGKRTTPVIGLQAAKTLADSAFGREAWDEVIEAERVAAVHLDALASRTEELFSRDATAAERGTLAAMAAYAAARTGAADAAISILERGRTTMIAERLRTAQRPPARHPRAGQPVVHLVTTPAGGLALISQHREPATVLWLDQIGGSSLEDRLSSYAAALEGVRRNSMLGMGHWRAEVARMVDALRDAFKPLRAAYPSGPLTVIPAGVLSMLPIAAALNSGVPARGITILPSLGLDPAWSADAPTEQVLVVADPALPSVRWEEAGVRAFFARPAAGAAGSSGMAPGTPAEATPGGVLAAFPPGGVVHFACHAAVEIGAPLRSALFLPGGGQLTVEDILRAGAAPARAVVLSACESGLNGPYLLDEVITLPVAFLAAGCAGVVSTLWLVEDLSAALLMLRFYWEWRHEGCPAPLALARAQDWLRSTSDRDKCRFAEAELVAAGVLGDDDGTTLADRIRERSAATGAANSYADPFFWAGFCFTGR